MNTYEGRSRNSGAAEQRCELLYSQIRADADVTVESQPMGRGGFQPYLNEWRRAQHTTLLVSEAHHKATAPPVGQGVHGKGSGFARESVHHEGLDSMFSSQV